ncbi:DUF3883 domain-containing protein [Pedobacter mendelii]|uniref:DUF3883 domain-containing protein n=1 Tax=Pedobacter mendelii TaxID=1908240 RepID=UPI003622EB37
MNKNLRIYLIKLARNRQTVAYGQAMADFDMDVTYPEQREIFEDMIGEISDFEDKKKRPMLSSLVMHKGKLSIGSGFYRLAEQLGHGVRKELSKSRFEKTMHRRCFEFWSDDSVFYAETGENPPAEPIEDYPIIPNDLAAEGYNELPLIKFTFQGHDIDWLKKAADDMNCGIQGEKLVVAYEKRVLHDAGCSHLALEVRKVQDGEGYDIFSKTEAGEDKFIEVKTTRGSQLSPFKISLNEIKFSQINPGHYYLYRLFNLTEDGKSANFNEFRGDLYANFFLEATEFEAFTIKK